MVAHARDHGGVIAAQVYRGNVNTNPFNPGITAKFFPQPAVGGNTADQGNPVTSLFRSCPDCFIREDFQNRFLKAGSNIRNLFLKFLRMIGDVTQNCCFNATETKIESGFVQIGSGKIDFRRIAIPGKAIDNPPPGYPRPSIFATLSNASPTASSRV